MIIEVVLGIVGVCFLLIYFSYNLDNTHFLWKYFITFFVIALLILIPKILLDYTVSPQVLSLNETIVGNSTITTHTVVVPDGAINTAKIFYKAMVRLAWIFSIYVFMYLNYVLWLKDMLIKNNFMKGKE